jgi:hypothetical protein
MSAINTFWPQSQRHQRGGEQLRLVDRRVHHLYQSDPFPAGYQSRKSMRRMSNLQPQITKLQKNTPTTRKSLTRKPPSFTARTY